MIIKTKNGFKKKTWYGRTISELFIGACYNRDIGSEAFAGYIKKGGNTTYESELEFLIMEFFDITQLGDYYIYKIDIQKS